MRLHSIVLRCLTGAFALHAAVASAAPLAPQVTSGADIKILRFDWNYVPRANYYELWFQANAGASWAKFGATPSSRPRIRTNVSAHLLDWSQARYQVKACNPSGCTGSPPLAVDDLVFDAIGYFKANPVVAGANFGDAVALSEDGSTLAVVASMEPNPQWGDTASYLYVFRKTAAGWQPEARLVPAPDEPLGHFPSISLSADGNVLALGLPYSLQVAPGPGTSGGVFLFRRTGSAWTQDALLQRELDEQADDQFGYVAKIDEAGDTVLVGRGGNTGISTIYEHTSTGWTHVIDIPHEDNWWCGRVFGAMTLSGDGRSLLRVCNRADGLYKRVEQYTAPTWARSSTLQYGLGNNVQIKEIACDFTASFSAFSTMPDTTQSDNRRWVYMQASNNGILTTNDTFSGPWQQWHEDKYGVTRWGEHLAVSRDGQYIAVTDAADSGAGYGVLKYPLQKGTRSSGAVFVYERKLFPTASNPNYYYYRLRRILKPNVPGSTTARIADGPIAFAQNGKTLASASLSNPSAATGVDGSRTNTSKPDAGAVWLY